MSKTITDLINLGFNYDVHTHILNKHLYPPDVFVGRFDFPDYVVDAFVTLLSGHLKELDLAEDIIKFFTGKLYNIDEMVELFNLDFDGSVKYLIGQMDKADIYISTPLMLDLAGGCGGSYVNMPFEEQIEAFGELSKKTNGRLLPFYGFDPCRKDAKELFIKAYEKGGFYGVKLYPALSFSPDYTDGSNFHEIDIILKWLYDYCESEGIPITSHCSTGGIKGAYVSDDIAHYRNSPNRYFEARWNHKKLRLNLAHFGGNNSFIQYFIDGKGGSASSLVYMMSTFENLFSDQAFHEGMFYDVNKYSKAFFTAMSDPLIAGHLLAGSDDPLIDIMYYEYQALSKLEQQASPYNVNLVRQHNPPIFLFGDGKLSQEIENFYF